MLRVDPHQIDSAIVTVHGPHIAVYDPQTTPRHRLFLFLVGTRGKATGSLPIDSAFARWGYHAISLDYEDNVIAVSRAHSLDRTSFGRYRDDPGCGWGEFLTNGHYRRSCQYNSQDRSCQLHPASVPGIAGLSCETHPAWSRIIVAGHSQGAGHAAYIGKLFRVDRVLMFSGPQDYMDDLHQPAPWLARKSATPPSRFFAFLNLKDPFNVNHQIANCMVLMDMSEPDARMVNPGEIIHGNYHILINDFPTKHRHGSTLFPQFENVWKYVATTKSNR